MNQSTIRRLLAAAYGLLGFVLLGIVWYPVLAPGKDGQEPPPVTRKQAIGSGAAVLALAGAWYFKRRSKVSTGELPGDTGDESEDEDPYQYH